MTNPVAVHPLRVVGPKALTLHQAEAYTLVTSRGKTLAFIPVLDDAISLSVAQGMAHALPVLDALRDLVLLVNERGGAIGMTSPEFWRVIEQGRRALAEVCAGDDDDA